MKFKQYLNEVKQKLERLQKFVSNKNLLDNQLHVETTGQNPERSYEDREVFIRIWLESTKEERKDISTVHYGDKDNVIQTWLTGEDAIKLGKQFIDSGNEALERNREHAYEIIQKLAAIEGINKGEYTKLIITKKSDTIPANYGPGFHYYDLLYVGKDDLMSRNIPDVVINWSPFENEFKAQLKNYGDIPVEMIGWSFDEIKKDFEKFKKEQEKNIN